MFKNILFLGISSLFFLSSCHYMSKKSCCGKKAWKKCCGASSAVGQADIQSVTKKKITGTVLFQQVGKYKVKVTANLKGLKPNQKFGFHVHEFGNCGNKALMAGAHFNPKKRKHGSPSGKEKHLGDLGNLESDSKGQVLYSAVMKGKARKFFGRSVIVHALPDDLKSQPTGKSGDRIACGVLVVAMPPASPTKEKSTKPVENVKKPSVEKKAPAKEVKKPSVEKKVPAKEVKKPSVEKKVPAKEVKKPSATKKAPAKEVKKPSATKKVPAKEVKKPSVEKKAPAKEVKKSSAKKKAPAKEVKKPSVEKKGSS